jgi:hypothetical protein
MQQQQQQMLMMAMMTSILGCPATGTPLHSPSAHHGCCTMAPEGKLHESDSE